MTTEAVAPAAPAPVSTSGEARASYPAAMFSNRPSPQHMQMATPSAAAIQAEAGQSTAEPPAPAQASQTPAPATLASDELADGAAFLDSAYAPPRSPNEYQLDLAPHQVPQTVEQAKALQADKELFHRMRLDSGTVGMLYKIAAKLNNVAPSPSDRALAMQSTKTQLESAMGKERFAAMIHAADSVFAALPEKDRARAAHIFKVTGLDANPWVLLRLARIGQVRGAARAAAKGKKN
jgi:hypothetical protein